MDAESTYFTTLGRQIKIVLRLQANQKITAEFGLINVVQVYYVYGGVSVKVSEHEFPSYWKWDFNNGELLETLYSARYNFLAKCRFT